MKKNKKIHFMHIPKTGGSTLWMFLESKFNLQEICPALWIYNKPNSYNPENILENLSIPQLENYSFFKGHLGWLPRKLLSEHCMDTFTFIRDPIELTLSMYSHLVRDESHFPKLARKWKSFEEFIFDPFLNSNNLLNQQTHHFCSDHYKRILPDDELREFFGTWIISSNLSSERLLELAIERLHACQFVGITEDYDVSLEMLCTHYNWLLPKKIPIYNQAAARMQKTNLPIRVIDRIMELNQLDNVLYQEGVKLFEDKKRVRVAFDINIFEKKFCARKSSQKKLDFNFENKMEGENWHPREGTSPNVFCWSAEKVSTLFFSIKPKNKLLLSIHIISSLVPDFQNRLTILANNHKIDLIISEHPEGGFLFEGIILKNMFRTRKRLLKLSFLLPEIGRPCDTNPNSIDTRSLGIACKSIKIYPENSPPSMISLFLSFFKT